MAARRASRHDAATSMTAIAVTIAGSDSGGGAGIQAGEKLLAHKVAADPAAGTHQDELTQPPRAWSRPGASGTTARGDRERAEQLDLHGLLR